MTKMKTEKIKQSLLWEDDKWAVCRRKEVMILFNPGFSGTMLPKCMNSA